MHARTEATLRQLDGIEWFTKVGVVDTKAAIVLGSWKQAMEACGSAAWQDLTHEAANQYCERLFERDRARFNRWNDVMLEVRPSAVELAQRKIAKVKRDWNLPSVFDETVEWDLMHLFMESEYADIQPPGFFASQSYWYANGHFPCGWKGQFPTGSLVIY